MFIMYITQIKKKTIDSLMYCIITHVISCHIDCFWRRPTVNVVLTVVTVPGQQQRLTTDDAANVHRFSSSFSWRTGWQECRISSTPKLPPPPTLPQKKHIDWLEICWHVRHFLKNLLKSDWEIGHNRFSWQILTCQIDPIGWICWPILSTFGWCKIGHKAQGPRNSQEPLQVPFDFCWLAGTLTINKPIWESQLNLFQYPSALIETLFVNEQ